MLLSLFIYINTHTPKFHSVYDTYFVFETTFGSDCSELFVVLYMIIV